MTKQLLECICLLLLGLFTACNNNTYSDELKREKELIADYISRQGIRVIEQDSMPEKWGQKDYWKVPSYDNLYFHLDSLGDTTRAGVETGNYVNMRFRQYTLTEYPDTIHMWNALDTPEPTTLKYGYSTDASCVAWQIAIKYMEYSYAQCKIICPSKLGFTSSVVTPYGYDLKMQIKRY